MLPACMAYAVCCTDRHAVCHTLHTPKGKPLESQAGKDQQLDTTTSAPWTGCRNLHACMTECMDPRGACSAMRCMGWGCSCQSGVPHSRMPRVHMTCRVTPAWPQLSHRCPLQLAGAAAATAAAERTTVMPCNLWPPPAAATSNAHPWCSRGNVPSPSHACLHTQDAAQGKLSRPWHTACLPWVDCRRPAGLLSVLTCGTSVHGATCNICTCSNTCTMHGGCNKLHMEVELPTPFGSSPTAPGRSARNLPSHLQTLRTGSRGRGPPTHPFGCCRWQTCGQPVCLLSCCYYCCHHQRAAAQLTALKPDPWP
jgi:hypothetical protein